MNGCVRREFILSSILGSFRILYTPLFCLVWFFFIVGVSCICRSWCIHTYFETKIGIDGSLQYFQSNYIINESGKIIAIDKSRYLAEK